MKISLPHHKIVAPHTEEEHGWMLSYSDMVTLLLAFFVLFFSISQIDQTKFEMMMEYFSKNAKMPLHQLEEVVKQLITEHNLEESVEVELTPDGLLLTFQDKILFASGHAELKQDAYPILNELGKILQTTDVADRQIRVEGHTDTVPLAKNSAYPSNWELSAARSTHVIRHLIATNIDPKRFVAIGYADTRLREQEAGQARGLQVNRRVSLIVK